PVHLDRGAGDVTTLRRYQQRDEVGDVVDGADTPHRNLLRQARLDDVGRLAARREHFLQTRGVDVSGADRVYVDPVLRYFQRQRLRVTNDARPCRDGQRETWDRLNRGNR